MPLFNGDDRGNKYPIKLLRLSCGNREVERRDRLGNIVRRADGTPLYDRVYDIPRSYILRLLPHAKENGAFYGHRESIKRHKDNSGLEHICEGSASGCPYCQEGLPSYQTHYSLVYLLNSDSNQSEGIYALEYSGWLEKSLKEFEDRMLSTENIDISSLLDDGCYLKISVTKKDRMTNYEIDTDVHGMCPFDNKIRNADDILRFVNSADCPDLEGWVNKKRTSYRKKSYGFQDATISTSLVDIDESEIIRKFNPDAKTLDEMFDLYIESVDDDHENTAENKIHEEINIDKEELKAENEISEDDMLANLEKELFG